MDAKKMVQFFDERIWRLTGSDFDNQLLDAQVATEAAFDQSDLRQYIPKVATEKVWARAFPAINFELQLFSSTLTRLENTIAEARRQLDKKLNPPKEQSEIMQLMAAQKEAEARTLLAAMSENDRFKTIQAALKKDDNFLLTAWLAGPVPQDDFETLEKVRDSFDEYRSKTIAQREFEVWQLNRDHLEKVSISINLARSTLFNLVNGQWRALETSFQQELLKTAGNVETLQACGVKVV
jgi:hypothetical protein